MAMADQSFHCLCTLWPDYGNLKAGLLLTMQMSKILLACFITLSYKAKDLPVFKAENLGTHLEYL